MFLPRLILRPCINLRLQALDNLLAMPYRASSKQPSTISAYEDGGLELEIRIEIGIDSTSEGT
jgi:hypothetical protein